MNFILLGLLICLSSVRGATWTGTASGLLNGSWKSSGLISSEWGVENYKGVTDPVTGSGTVLRITMPEGTYGGTPNKGYGVNVFPFGKTAQMTKATYEYDVYFPDAFRWIKGGKLSGIFGGVDLGKNSCTGGDDALDCFSARLMWGDSSLGYPYLYLPKNGAHLKEFCALTNHADCDRGHAGFAFDKKNYFSRNKWIHVKQHIELNTPKQANGVLKVWIDGVLKASYDKVIWRTLSSVYIKGFILVSFFGGGSSDWAPLTTSYDYFKGFKFSDF
jgi:hypothetical protein